MNEKKIKTDFFRKVEGRKFESIGTSVSERRRGRKNMQGGAR